MRKRSTAERILYNHFMKYTKFVLSAIFLGSGLSQLILASVAWTSVGGRGGGALAMILLFLGLLNTIYAAWLYKIGIDKKETSMDRQIDVLAVMSFLQVVPLSLAFGIYTYPLLVGSLAFLLGAAPHGIYLLRGKIEAENKRAAKKASSKS